MLKATPLLRLEDVGSACWHAANGPTMCWLQTCSSGVINLELNIVTRNFARHHVLLS